MSNFVHKPVQLKYNNLKDIITKAGRLYLTPSNDWYPSVTTFLGHFGKEGIENWKKAVGEKEAKRVGHHAATRGTAVHNTAERYINNEKEYMQECVMPHVRQMWSSLKTILDTSINNVYMQECPLYSDKLMLAGRVDLIAEYDEKLSIIDFKTSSRVKSADEIENYFLQACAYSMMFEEQSGIHIDQLVIIMVIECSNQTKVFIESRKDWEEKLLEKRNQFFNDIKKKVLNEK